MKQGWADLRKLYARITLDLAICGASQLGDELSQPTPTCAL
jgi:hypothetical protein